MAGNKTVPEDAVTTVYFVRHAQSDGTVRDVSTRPLTERGGRDAEALVSVFGGIAIDRIYSSPYQRAVDTVRPLAAAHGLDIELVDAFRERRSDAVRTMKLVDLIKRQWSDFSYTESDGECLQEVQERNVSALAGLLSVNDGRTIVVGTHGMALCTILKHFCPDMGMAELARILPVTPYVVCLNFRKGVFSEREDVPLPRFCVAELGGH